MTIFSINGFGLSLRTKLVSTNDRPSIFSIMFRLFSKRGRNTKLRRILQEPVGGAPRHVCGNFRANNRTSYLPMFNIKQNLAKKLDRTLKLSHLKEMTYRSHFYAKVQKYTPFLSDTP